MSRTFLKMWCEWDYGQDDVLFVTEDCGKRWLERQIIRVDGSWPRDIFGENIQTIFDEGLAGFSVVTLVTE